MKTRTPTVIQLLGLAVTLGAVAVFSLFTLSQLRGLRRLESEIVDRNRRDSLQLIRVQNNLTQIGLALRDMTEGSEPYPLSAYRPEFERIRGDLDDALSVESKLMPATRNAGQQRLLQDSFARFWGATAELWRLAEAGDKAGARALIQTRLEADRATMTTVTSRLLMQNNEVEAEAAREITTIYAKVERNLYALIAAVLGAILLTSALVIRHDRRVFAQLNRLSEERKELAGQVISVQEDVFRTLARELHDEFGQVLTALGMMLQRVERRMPEGSREREDLLEVRTIANQTLERVRGMSQMLHPPVLDDYGLEKSIEWYLGQYQKQTGVEVRYEKIGVAPWIGEKVSIHVYRVLQEALNNVAKHAGTGAARVEVHYDTQRVELVVEDHGPGLRNEGARKGIGLVAMRERAELLGGEIRFETPDEGGVRVRLTVPLGTITGEKA